MDYETNRLSDYNGLMDEGSRVRVWVWVRGRALIDRLISREARIVGKS